MPLILSRILEATLWMATVALVMLGVLSASGQPVEPPGLMERLQRLEGRVAQTEQRVARVEAASGVAAVEPEYGTVPLDGDVFPPALPEAAGPGFYAGSGELLGVFAPGTNLFDPIRDGLRQHDVLRVRLLAGETYRLTHTGRHNEAAWLAGKTLVIEATPGEERAKLLVGPSEADGRYRTPFVLGRQANAVGHLRLDGVSITAPGRMPTDSWSPINFGGMGRLEVLNSELADAHHGIDANRGSDLPGIDLLVENSIIRDMSAPARDLSFDGHRGSPSTGIFAGGYRRIVVRGCVFERIGYRADEAQLAIPNIYNHGIYLAVSAGEVDAETTRRMGDVVIEDNRFLDISGWAAQLRGGAEVRSNLVIDAGFGFTLPRGSMRGNVILRARRVWKRDGTAPTLEEIEALGISGAERWLAHGWHSHGGQGLNIAHQAKGSSPRYLHGPVEVAGNVLADTAYEESGRAPLSHETGVERGWYPGLDDATRGRINAALRAARDDARAAGEAFNWGDAEAALLDHVDFVAGGTYEIAGEPATVLGESDHEVSLGDNLALGWPHRGFGTPANPMALPEESELLQSPLRSIGDDLGVYLRLPGGRSQIDLLAELASHLPRGGGDARFGAGALVGEGVGR